MIELQLIPKVKQLLDSTVKLEAQIPDTTFIFFTASAAKAWRKSVTSQHVRMTVSGSQSLCLE